MHRTSSLFAAAVFLLSTVLFASTASAEQCWVAGYIFRNNGASVGSVSLDLRDTAPTTATYQATVLYQPGEQKEADIYGLFPDSSVTFASSANGDTPDMTFIGFGPFGQVDIGLCAKPAPTLDQSILFALAALLAAMGAWLARRRARAV
jgi:hypothetical protein